ncbi:MAG: tRNA (adenosine(37)-N6)-threonylcarbamoyltransferase complex dimerization subunit type 1 TsaB [Pseudomonadota bacterium]
MSDGRGPHLLILDSAADRCAVGLFTGGQTLVERSEARRTGHAERLMPMAEDAMAEAGVALSDLAAIVVSTGPGSFTGVRIAVAAARGLALALGCPAIGVSRLEALAHRTPRPTLVGIDAGRGRLAVQLFTDEAGGEPEVADITDLSARRWPADLTVLGDAATMLAPQAGLSAGSAEVNPPLAHFAEIARDRLSGGAPRPAPLYLRPADAAPPSEAPPPRLP